MAVINSSMTWTEVVAALGVADLGWNDIVRAVAAAFGSGDNEEFIDWLINGAVEGTDTIDKIYSDWEDEDA